MGIFSNLLEMAPQVGAQGFQGASAGQQIRTDREAREADAEARKQRAIRDEMFRQATLDLQRKREERLSAPEAPEDPTFRASAGGVSTEFGSEEEARDFVDRNAPAEGPASMTPGQASTERHREATRLREEALGNAVTWIRNAEEPGVSLDRNRIINLIRDQHGIASGEAARIYERALAQLGGEPEADDAVTGTRVAELAGGDGLSPSRKDAVASTPEPSLETREAVSGEEAAQARRAVAGLDPAQAREQLAGAGYTEDEINQILGGG